MSPFRWLWNQPVLLLMLGPLFWAGNAVLARGVSQLIPPFSLSFWRWLLAFLILLPFTYAHVKRDWKKALQSWKILTILAITGVTSFNSLLYSAAHTTSAINIAILQCTMPAFIILGSFLIFKDKITPLQLLGTCICISGAVIVVCQGRWQMLLELTFVRGDLLMLIANVFYGAYSIFLTKRPVIHPLSFLTYTFGIGVLGVVPFYVWELFEAPPIDWNYQVFSSVLYVAVFPSIAAYLCWNRGVELIGANRTGLFVNLVPIYASFLAILFLGESLHLFHFIGMGFIFGGIRIYNWKF